MDGRTRLGDIGEAVLDENFEVALSHRSDEDLLGLLTWREEGQQSMREAVATELAYRLGIFREVAQLHADLTLDLGARGEDACALAELEAACAAGILTESRALLDARRVEGNVAARLKVHLADLARAVERARFHLRSLRRLGDELHAGSLAVTAKIEREP